jgi:hypothetical protein
MKKSGRNVRNCASLNISKWRPAPFLSKSSDFQIDLERVRQWLKMDELLEKERQIRNSMASRAGVLALMLHSTYNHEVMEQITKASQQDQNAMQRELAKRFRTTTKSRFS